MATTIKSTIFLQKYYILAQAFNITVRKKLRVVTVINLVVAQIRPEEFLVAGHRVAQLLRAALVHQVVVVLAHAHLVAPPVVDLAFGASPVLFLLMFL